MHHTEQIRHVLECIYAEMPVVDVQWECGGKSVLSHVSQQLNKQELWVCLGQQGAGDEPKLLKGGHGYIFSVTV